MNKNELYLDNGYLNFDMIMNIESPFIFITGGRGIGKSYGCIKWMIENKKSFLYLRRSEIECKLQTNNITSQLSPVIDDLGMKMEFSSIDKMSVCTVSNGSRVFLGALSTFSNLRGIDLRACEYIVYDEFIPEIHARKIKEEGLAFANVYETTARNRELEGGKPLKAILLSNSLNIDCDIYRTFDIIPMMERLISEDAEMITEGVKTVIRPNRSPISNKKRKTALYQAVSDEYASMSLDNQFIMNDFSVVKKRNKNEYNAYIQIGEITILRHKTRKEYYVIFARQKSPIEYPDTIAGRTQFRREQFHRIYGAYLDNEVTFENYNAVSFFEKYFS